MQENIDLRVPPVAGEGPVAAEAEVAGALERRAVPVPVSLRSVVTWLALIGIPALLAIRGIGNEAVLSTQGDMPRYLMNGVFVRDLISDLPLADPLGYAYKYYARYPALSLGHHAPLLGILEAPFFTAFGVSVLAGRVFVVVCFLVAVAAWFKLAGHLYGRRVALLAALLFATAPYVDGYAQVVLAEIPALMFVILGAHFLVRYCEQPRWRDALLCAAASVFAVYARYHAVFMLPVFAIYLLARRGGRALLRPQMLVAGAIIVLGIAAIWPMVMHYSRANVAWVAQGGGHSRLSWDNLFFYARQIWVHQVTPAVVVFGLIGAAVAVWRRDGRALLPVLWIAAFYAEITYTGVHEGRYAIFWIPAFCLLAASCVDLVRTSGLRLAATAALWGVVLYQGVAAYRHEPTTLAGYEDAARYVVEQGGGDSVLFSGPYDTGYFVFFVRKHDPARRLVVLRADKVLATSSLGRIIADVAHAPDDIYRALRQFGVRYVVVEDIEHKSPALEMLRKEVRAGPFALRRRILVQSNQPHLQGIELAVYEYLEHTGADPEAVLRMRVPLMGEEIAVRFGALLPAQPGR